MKKYYFISLLVLPLILYAQPKVGYYDAAIGKTEAALKSQLYSIISTGSKDVGYDGLFAVYATSDITADGNVWDMYSTCTFNLNLKRCGNYKVVCDCHNREHTIPQSWFSSKKPMVSDAFQVYPTDGKVNGQRSNFPYGECLNGTTLTNGKGKLGNSSFPGYSSTVFEPDNEYKGDLARTYFYFATRYQNIMTSIGGASFNGSTYPSFPTWTINLFLKWHREDPVSQKETDRNNAVERHQKNRNPFIDYPMLAEHIWGNKKGQSWSVIQSNDPAITSPTNGGTIDFGIIPYLQSTTYTVDISAINLTGDLNVILSGGDVANFSLSTNSITKTEAETGYLLNVNLNAQKLGLQSTNLIISGGGASTTTVILKARSTDAFLALNATNITSNSFNANWSSSVSATSYLLDVYTKTISGNGSAENILEADFNGSIPTGWTTKGYTDLTTQGFVRLGSSGNPGEIITPTVDLSQAGKKLVVNAQRYGSDTDATLTVKVDDQILSAWTTTSTVQEFSVDLPIGNANSTISFSAAKSKRVYIESIMVQTIGSSISNVSLNGYPANVGNVLTYKVDNLESDSTYFYQVSPVGSSIVPSDEIEVKTSGVTATKDLEANNIIYYYATNDGIHISKLPSNAVVSVYNLFGSLIHKVQTNTSDIELKLPQKGIYLLQVIDKNDRSVIKVRY